MPQIEKQPVKVNKLRKGDIVEKKYKILEVLGEGIFFNTYLTASTSSDEVFIMKSLSKDKNFDEKIFNRFIDESKKWIDLQSNSNINKISLINESYENPFLLMEYISPSQLTQNSLSGYIRENSLNTQQILGLAIQFCSGMEYTYSKGIKAHGNIKPSNILITQDGIVKITDYSLASVPTEIKNSFNCGWNPDKKYFGISFQTVDGQGYGTPPYMPPEQFYEADNLDMRSDLYNFGIVLFEAVSGGKMPYFSSAPVLSTLNEFIRFWNKMHHQHVKSSIPKIKSPLYPIIRKCLMKNSSDRYQDFKNLRMDLEALFLEITQNKYIPNDQNKLKASDLNNKGLCLGILGKNNDALALFNKASTLDPDNSLVIFNKGVFYQKTGMLAESILNLEKAAVSYPKRSVLWNLLGCSYSKTGKFGDALKCFDKALEVEPRMIDAHINKGLVCMEIDGYHQAFEIFSRALGIEPKNLKLLILKGLSYIGLKKFNDALKCYDKVLEMEPLNVEALNERGNCLKLMNRLEEAIYFWNKSAEADPKYPDVWVSKGIDFNDKELFESAVQHFDRALQFNEKNSEAWGNRGFRFFKMNKFEEAVRNYDTALTIKQWDVVTIVRKGNALMELGKRSEALTCFEKAIELYPLRLEGWISKGNMLYSTAQYEEAINCYNKVIEINPKFLRVWLNKGDCFRLLGLFQESLQCYDEAIKINKDDPNIWMCKGDSYRGLSLYSKAINCYDKALALDPNLVIALINKGDSLRWSGKNKQAIECFERANSLTPNSAKILIRLGNIHLNLKEYEEAGKYFDAILKLEANNLRALFGKAFVEEKLGHKQLALNIWQKYINLAQDIPAQKEFLKTATEHFKDLNINF